VVPSRVLKLLTRIAIKMHNVLEEMERIH
jgi:hypothetical protein